MLAFDPTKAYDASGQFKDRRLLVDLRGKTIEDLRGELELIDRTIVALERLGRLRSEIPSSAAPSSRREERSKAESPRSLKVLQTH